MIKIYIVEPIEVLKEFLRSNVDEITRSNPALSNRQVADTQSFNGTGSEDTFTLTNKPYCINSVIVDSVTQKKYYHYEIDLENKKIKFNSGYEPGVGTNNVVVSYDKTATWIYPDKARDDLSQSSYPRIGIIHLTESSNFQGIGTTNTYDSISFQIDVVAYKDQICTVDGENISGADVTQYLARDIIKKIKRNGINIDSKFYHPVILNNFPVPFESDKHIIRRIIEVKFTTNNAGE